MRPVVPEDGARAIHTPLRRLEAPSRLQQAALHVYIVNCVTMQVSVPVITACIADRHLRGTSLSLPRTAREAAKYIS